MATLSPYLDALLDSVVEKAENEPPQDFTLSPQLQAILDSYSVEPETTAGYTGLPPDLQKYLDDIDVENSPAVQYIRGYQEGANDVLEEFEDTADLIVDCYEMIVMLAIIVITMLFFWGLYVMMFGDDEEKQREREDRDLIQKTINACRLAGIANLARHGAVACEPTPACVVEIATPDQPASGEEVVSEAPPSYDKLQTKAKHLHTYV